MRLAVYHQLRKRRETRRDWMIIRLLLLQSVKRIVTRAPVSEILLKASARTQHVKEG